MSILITNEDKTHLEKIDQINKMISEKKIIKITTDRLKIVLTPKNEGYEISGDEISDRFFENPHAGCYFFENLLINGIFYGKNIISINN